MPRKTLIAAILAVLMGCLSVAQEPGAGERALSTFRAWRAEPGHAHLKWGEALGEYRSKLLRDGLSEAEAETTLRLVTAYDEGEFYNTIYAGEPTFNARPNAFLVEAVVGLRPGKALDVGMGQGRNALYLAGLGWDVTGFDVSAEGLEKARERARADGLAVTAVHAADVEFPFGFEQWDLIVIVHALEKRSVYRVGDALRPGGYVLVEASHVEPGGYPFGYESNELLKIFEGFRIIRYEELMGSHDFSQDRGTPQSLVRVLAQKPW